MGLSRLEEAKRAWATEELFAGLAAMGVQVDEQGNIVGAALTARQTAHRVQVGDQQLYVFRAREAAEKWALGRSGVTILSVAEADELAQEHWVERTRRALGRLGPRDP